MNYYLTIILLVLIGLCCRIGYKLFDAYRNLDANVGNPGHTRQHIRAMLRTIDRTHDYDTLSRIQFELMDALHDVRSRLPRR